MESHGITVKLNPISSYLRNLKGVEKAMGQKTTIPETSAEEWAQIFLKDHMDGEKIFKIYEKWCQENNRPVIKHTVFFLKIYQFFGAL